MDEGIGIKPEDRKRLFKPFTKLDSGKSLNPNGIGLGLSICKSILVKIGCDIIIAESAVESETSKVHGTSIAFSMPVFRESSVLSPALDPISEADVSQTDLSD